MMRPVSGPIDISPEVARALAARSPVVALESAVYSHGLPQQQARATARRLDEAVRAAGVTPALVVVRDGSILVGADPLDMGFLFEPDALKIAEGDLAVAVARGQSGGTTVAATMAVVAEVGIMVMATGGIGGVHLGAQASWDVSGDLHALSRYPIVVVCAGAKAICDPAKTVEALDTLGVTVVGYRTEVMPAFYARSSGIPVPHRADAPEEIAAIARARTDLGHRAALLVVQPCPEHAALDTGTVSAAVDRALAKARSAGIMGGAVTPYLLSAIAEATGGRALTANLALLEANARLAASVALALAASVGTGDR